MRAWQRVDGLEAAREAAERHRRRHLRLWLGADGSWVLRGRLDSEVGALLQSALEWAGDALYRRDASAAGETGEEETSLEQRWADAVGPVVERAMMRRKLDEGESGEGADMGEGAGESQGAPHDARDASGEKLALPPLGRPDRFQVAVHADAATLGRSAMGAAAAAAVERSSRLGPGSGARARARVAGRLERFRGSVRGGE